MSIGSSDRRAPILLVLIANTGPADSGDDGIPADPKRGQHILLRSDIGTAFLSQSHLVFGI
jgi:hypothetical protein